MIFELIKDFCLKNNCSVRFSIDEAKVFKFVFEKEIGDNIYSVPRAMTEESLYCNNGKYLDAALEYVENEFKKKSDRSQVTVESRLTVSAPSCDLNNYSNWVIADDWGALRNYATLRDYANWTVADTGLSSYSISDQATNNVRAYVTRVTNHD